MKKVKVFVKENKVLLICVGLTVVGGVIAYKFIKIDRKLAKEGAEILRVLSSEPLFPAVESVIEVGTF
jgi:hypothetical protein